MHLASRHITPRLTLSHRRFTPMDTRSHGLMMTSRSLSSPRCVYKVSLECNMREADEDSLPFPGVPDNFPATATLVRSPSENKRYVSLEVLHCKQRHLRRDYLTTLPFAVFSHFLWVQRFDKILVITRFLKVFPPYCSNNFPFCFKINYLVIKRPSCH